MIILVLIYGMMHRMSLMELVFSFPLPQEQCPLTLIVKQNHYIHIKLISGDCLGGPPNSVRLLVGLQADIKDKNQEDVGRVAC